MKEFLKSMFSVDERRVSTLIICLLISIVFMMVIYIKNGDITNNLKDIIITLIFCVAGINGVDIFKDIINRSNNNEKKYEA